MFQALKRLAGTNDNDGGGVLLPALGSANLVMEVRQAEDLVAKDRNLLRRRTTSDPFVKIFVLGQKEEIGRTQVISKNLSPVWNEKLDWTLDADDHVLKRGIDLLFVIMDKDAMSGSDPMGVVKIHVNLLEPLTGGWYDVDVGEGDFACPNATGRLRVAISVSGRNVPSLQPGNSISVRSPPNLPWKMYTAWDAASLDDSGEDLNDSMPIMTSCIAISNSDRLWAPQLSAYFGNKNAVNGSLMYDCETTHRENFSLFPWLLSKDHTYYFVTRFPMTKNGNKKGWLNFRMRILGNDPTAGYELRPRTISNQLLVAVRLQFHSGEWILQVLDEPRLDGSSFGDVFPELLGYDGNSPLPGGTDRFAVLRVGLQMDLSDYYSHNHHIRISLEWKLQQPDRDVDAAIVCLDAASELVEIISFRQLRSRDGAIRHGGDARKDESDIVDEHIDIQLSQVDERVTCMALVVNAYHDEGLDLTRLTCTLEAAPEQVSHPNTDHLLAHFALEEPSVICGSKSLVVGAFLRKDEDDWSFVILSKTAPETVEEDSLEPVLGLLQQSNSTTCHHPVSPQQPSLPTTLPLMVINDDVAIPAFEFASYMVEREIELD